MCELTTSWFANLGIVFTDTGMNLLFSFFGFLSVKNDSCFKTKTTLQVTFD